MIKKLKRKFIFLSITALFILLTSILAGTNLINYTELKQEADDTLFLLAKSKEKDHDPEPHGNVEEEGKEARMPPKAHSELSSEARYFSITLDASGAVTDTETEKIETLNETKASEYAKDAWEQDRERGFVKHFRFLRTYEENTVCITFLDCCRELDAFYSFMGSSIAIAILTFVIVCCVLCICSERLIRPIAESYEKQKRFITDAGHEIKTPLTIIQANVDLLSMELGENEALGDIAQQAQRLTCLTNELIRLTRMEEAEHNLPMIDFPLSEVVEEAVGTFRSAASARSVEIRSDIKPLLSLRGNAKAIGHLVRILMDNAVKYCREGDVISVYLTKTGKSLTLSVCNPTEEPVNRDSLAYVFDRFWRADPSRNSEVSGHGIGLSVAKAITQAHGGKIHAWTEDGMSFGITVSLPSQCAEKRKVKRTS